MLKDILDFILNEHRLHLFFIHLAWIAPLTGIAIGLFLKHFRKDARFIFLKSLFWGVLGSIVSIMWWMYNSIMNHYGLDSVKALVINFALFIAAGLILGLLYRRLQHAANP